MAHRTAQSRPAPGRAAAFAWSRGLPPQWLPQWLPQWPPLLVALLAVLPAAVAGCGLKTPPRPLSEVLQPTAGVAAYHRDESVLVSWQPPGPEQVQRFGGTRGYVLLVQVLPLLCLDCPPVAPERLTLPADAPELELQGGRLHYRLPFPPEAGRLRIQVRTRFAVGTTPRGEAVLVERPGEIPTPALQWRPLGEAAVQLYWEPPRERIVQVIGADGQPRERVLDYRANLYRREPPQPWPLQPLNSAPLAAAQYTLPAPPDGAPPGGPRETYALRYVDRFGNEGPLSPELHISPPEGRR